MPQVSLTKPLARSSHGLPTPNFWEDFRRHIADKCLILLVPGEGLEPPTNGLQNRCSTAELTRRINDLAYLARSIATGLPPALAWMDAGFIIAPAPSQTLPP